MSDIDFTDQVHQPDMSSIESAVIRLSNYVETDDFRLDI